MTFVFTLVSIIVVTVIVWLVGKASPLKVCALCGGVFLTWTALVALRYAGYAIEPVIPALLMGGSSVGIAFQLEKSLSRGQNALVWKTIFVLAGFTAAYLLLRYEWLWFALAALAFASLALIGTRPLQGGREGGKVKELEKKLESCC